MLHWKRVVNPYEWERCYLTNDYIRYGEWYLEDDEDGLIVSAKEYAKLKKEKREHDWDYSKFQNAQNEREYEQMFRDADRDMKAQTLLNRKIEGGYGE